MIDQPYTLPIIPKPKHITHNTGQFVITSRTVVMASETMQTDAQGFVAWIKSVAGFDVPIQSTPKKNGIVLSLSAAGQPESYTLQITPEQIVITGADRAGLFYGLQTLQQIVFASLPLEQAETLSVPALSITDAPRYGWRGLHLDVARHMHPVDFIKKFIDLMALHKMNVFHWHLTDDQGWRIEITQYPRLTEIGAFRTSSPTLTDRTVPDNQPHGGYYTQEEIREVVAYAAERHITILPEIDMPGHMVAALASYPELGCVGRGYEVRTTWGIAEDVLCAGNEQVYSFVESVLAEVLELFPGEYIHIGGDECPKARWRECPKCQAMIQREGLKDEYELQSYFVKRVGAFLKSQGRRMIGWDEILEGGLAPDATVMSWRGIKGGIEAANAGHHVILTPTSHCYFDYYQSQDIDNEPPAMGHYLPLEKVYRFEPKEGFSPDTYHLILGGQGNIWTEFMPTQSQVEYMTFPRSCAMAEALWSETRSYDDFMQRLQHHLGLLDHMKVAYRNPF